MKVDWFQSEALGPQEFYDECVKYQVKYSKTYSIAFDIVNYQEIIKTCNYDNTKKVTDLFYQYLKNCFSDSIIGTLLDGNFILITKYSSHKINQKFEKLLNHLEREHQVGNLPMKIIVRCGIAENIHDCNTNLKNAVTSMLYFNGESIYLQYYRPEMDEKKVQEENFISKLDNWLENDEIKQKLLKIKTIDQSKVIIEEIRMIDPNGEDLFQGQNLELIEKYKRRYKLDQYNLRCIFDRKKLTFSHIMMFNINFNTIFTKHYEFINKIKDYVEKHHIDPKQICFNINYLDYNGQLMNLLYETRAIKNAGFLLSIQSLGILEKSQSPAIAASIEVDYIKVGKRTLIKAMNEKRLHIILKSFVEMYLALDIVPIFTDIDGLDQINYIKNLDSRCLIREV